MILRSEVRSTGQRQIHALPAISYQSNSSSLPDFCVTDWHEFMIIRIASCWCRTECGSKKPGADPGPTRFDYHERSSRAGMGRKLNPARSKLLENCEVAQYPSVGPLPHNPTSNRNVRSIIPPGPPPPPCTADMADSPNFFAATSSLSWAKGMGRVETENPPKFYCNGHKQAERRCLERQ